MMTARQVEFFQRLCAPFPERALFTKPKGGGGKLTFCKARTIMNRLDDVAGPAGWTTKYTVHPGGVTCTLAIEVPSGEAEGTYVWIEKEDGAGYEGMSAADDNQKSGHTNAFRRAAAAWGIARYLYNEGVPIYMGAEPAIPDLPCAAAAPPAAAPTRQAQQPQQQAAPSGPPQRQPQGPPQRQPQGQPQDQQQGGQKQFDNTQPPKMGKGLYPWVMNLQKEYNVTGVLDLLNQIGREFGYQGQSKEYTADQTMYVGWAIVDDLKTWPAFQGVFDHLADPRPPATVAANPR